jgi:catechol 2,3-dioxygenase-like lactoylglutathione lyase family enzyme
MAMTEHQSNSENHANCCPLRYTLIYPYPLQTVKVAYLVTGDGIGLELFEFIDPPYRRPASAHDSDPSAFTPEIYARGGFFHIALTVLDIDATCASIILNGGHQIGEKSG